MALWEEEALVVGQNQLTQGPVAEGYCLEVSETSGLWAGLMGHVEMFWSGIGGRNLPGRDR